MTNEPFLPSCSFFFCCHLGIVSLVRTGIKFRPIVAVRFPGPVSTRWRTKPFQTICVVTCRTSPQSVARSARLGPLPTANPITATRTTRSGATSDRPSPATLWTLDQVGPNMHASSKRITVDIYNESKILHPQNSDNRANRWRPPRNECPGLPTPDR